MSRRINSGLLHVAGPSGKTSEVRIDGYFDRVIKYVPADVVGAWVAAAGIIPQPASAGSSMVILWACFAFGIVVTFAWTWKQTNGLKDQVLISTAAFIVWVFALGGPFKSFTWYESFQGSLALIGFTLLSGFAVPRDRPGDL